MVTIHIKSAITNFEREPLIRPFGFKGSYMSEIWQSAAMLQSRSGVAKIGIGTQNALWSDAQVFTSRSANAAEAAMYMMTDFAAQRLVGRSFTSPMELFEELLPEVYAYGVRATGNTVNGAAQPAAVRNCGAR